MSCTKVYSKDLRKKVSDAYLNNQGSVRQIAERFMVSLTSVFNLIKRFGENGHINPESHGRGMTGAINSEGCQFLSGLISRQTDLAPEELCGHYEERFGKKAGRSAMGRTLKKMKMTRKKNSLRSGKRQWQGQTAYSGIL